MIKKLDWDSSFFGLKTGRLDLITSGPEDSSGQLKLIEGTDFQLIYIFTPHKNNALKIELEKKGARLVDEKVTYSMDISGLETLSSGLVYSCLGSPMDNDLEALALESGKYSRFRIDDKIPREKFEGLYRLWMVNSLNGKFAKDVFAYVDSGRKLGMASVDVRNEEGWIGIIAVDEASRGRSIGKLLMHAAIRFCQQQKINTLNVQTQVTNKVSCAFYEKLGFSVKNIEDVYHYRNEK